MRIGSLFSGYGGLDGAVEQVFGAETAWVSDIDPGACKILAHRFPDVPNLGDITRIDWAAVEPVDIITGGYPCQPFSQAGARLGTEDHRHLWPYVVEALSALRPPYAVFENVRGHLTLGFDQVIRDLHLLGYAVEWFVLKASDLGACHARARIFILARLVRGRADRRGGLHRDIAPRWVRHLCNPRPGGDGHEGHVGIGETALGVRRSDRDQAARDGAQCGEGCLAAGWSRGLLDAHADQGSPDPEGGSSGLRDRALGVHPQEQGAAGSEALERLPEAACSTPDVEASGGKRPGPAGRHARAGCGCDCGLALGRVVAAGGEPLRTGPVHGSLPHVGSDGGWSDLPGLTLLPTPITSAGTGAGEHGTGGPNLQTAVALLPTPAAANPNDGESVETWDARRQRTQERVGNGNGFGTPLSIAVQLLPTPAANLGSNGGPQHPDKRRAGGHSVSIEDAVHGLALLPTPTVMDHKASGGNPDTTGTHGTTLTDATVRQPDRWGQYAAAIASHELLTGRPAPEPTELGPKGKPRLSARFVEWMMCLPDGWVTDVPGVTRIEALKALGNGVVPLQAVAALRHLGNPNVWRSDE